MLAALRRLTLAAAVLVASPALAQQQWGVWTPGLGAFGHWSWGPPADEVGDLPVGGYGCRLVIDEGTTYCWDGDSWEPQGGGGGTLAGDVDGDVASNDLDEAAVETELEAVLDIPQLQGQAGDAQIADGAVDGGTGGEIADGSVTASDLAADSVAASELDASAVESELEAVLDLQDLQGAVTDGQVPNNVTIDLAAAATALAANGANCSAGSYALGVDASGAAESCTADDDTPDAGDFGAATDLDSNGAVDADSVALGTDTTGGYAASSTEGGAATTATALAANPTDCDPGDFANAIDASGNLTCDAAGGGSPGGSDTQVQFNDGGAFSGDAGLTYNKTTDALTLGGGLFNSAAGDIGTSGARWGTGYLTVLNSQQSVVDNITIDGNTISSTDTDGAINLTPNGDGKVVLPTALASGPRLAWGDGNTGFAETSNDQLTVLINGSQRFHFAVNYLDTNASGGPRIYASTTSATVPTLIPSESDLNTGEGWNVADDARLIAGGVSRLSYNGNANSESVGFQNGNFAADGDARSRVFTVRNSTTTATPAELFLNGSSTRMALANDSTWTFDCLVTARRTDADNESAAYQLIGAIDRQTNAASTALVGAVATPLANEDTAAWGVTATADTTNGALILTVTGEASKTIRWVGSCRTVETTG